MSGPPTDTGGLSTPVRLDWGEPAFFRRTQYSERWPPRWGHAVFAAMTAAFAALPLLAPPADPSLYWLMPLTGAVCGAGFGYGRGCGCG